MDHWDKIRHNQRILERGKAIEVRIGEDAPRATGFTLAELERHMRIGYHKLKEGLNRLLYHSPKGQVVLYVRNMGGLVELGTKEDMRKLGVAEVCDMLDLKARG